MQQNDYDNGPFLTLIHFVGIGFDEIWLLTGVQ